MINETLINTNKRLFGDDYDIKTEKDNNEFKYYPLATNKMKEYLSYIYEWNGLSSSAKIPSTYKEYENKARNWLNVVDQNNIQIHYLLI